MLLTWNNTINSRSDQCVEFTYRDCGRNCDTQAQGSKEFGAIIEMLAAVVIWLSVIKCWIQYQ